MQLKDEVGIWIEDPQDIKQKFLTDFTNRFKIAQTTPQTFPHLGLPKLITNQDNDMLTAPPTAAEIKTAVFDINPNKTPGPDGFGAGFFQKYWQLVSDEFVHFIKDFFSHGKLLKEINHTFITLIPKNAQLQLTSHFRPISLCSTIYKTIAEILVNRL